MNRMFKNIGAERPTVAEVLAHPWLAGELGPVDDMLRADLRRRVEEVRKQKREEREKAAREKEAARQLRAVVHTSPTPRLVFFWA